jgi:hypothetical protein
VPATSSSPAEGIADSLEHEARRLLAAARATDVPLHLLGGMGIRLLLGEHLHPGLRREIADLDFITTRRAGAAVERLLADRSWEPRRRFNAINGARRLLFDEPHGERHIDVFVGSFRMCHELPLLEHLTSHAETLPAAELLLTKLQIVTLNAKDRGDSYALLLACEVAEHDAAATGTPDGAATGAASAVPAPDAAGAAPVLEAARIATLAAADWGLYHTIELNLARLRDGLSDPAVPPAGREAIALRIAALESALRNAPKSRAWRMRARVGERRRWYEDPEEIAR